MWDPSETGLRYLLLLGTEPAIYTGAMASLDRVMEIEPKKTLRRWIGKPLADPLDVHISFYLRRAPFDTSQVLIGPPCLNKVDFGYLSVSVGKRCKWKGGVLCIETL